MKFKYAHTMLRVFDLEKSLKFYEKGLGLHVDHKKDYPGDFALVFLTDDDHTAEIELTYNYGREEGYEIGTAYGHLAFHVADLDGAKARFEELGYEVGPTKKLADGSDEYFFVNDPDGYRVELIRNENIK